MKIETSFQTATGKNLRSNRPASAPSSVAFSPVERSSYLEPSMDEVPDVRAEQIARGKALIADPNYPSVEQIKAISQLLASRLSRRSI